MRAGPAFLTGYWSRTMPGFTDHDPFVGLAREIQICGSRNAFARIGYAARREVRCPSSRASARRNYGRTDAPASSRLEC